MKTEGFYFLHKVFCANPVQIKKGSKLNRLKPLSHLWAHLGSNQGPPDYESGALTG